MTSSGYRYANDTSNEIRRALESAFKTNGLELTYREIQASKSGTSLEFLDVEHVIDTNSVPWK